MNTTTVHLEIPVRNRERAIGFYSTLLGLDLKRESTQSLQFEERGEGGASVLWLRIDCLDEALAIVWSNGGYVLDAEPSIDGSTQSALVMDSEGNRVALFAD